jgi:NADH-quinone oxidoreductase subunit J
MTTDMVINIILGAALVLAAVWTVMTARLLRSVIGLALTSMILTIIMFKLNSPLAAVFELSVCAGLISAIFISCISLTQRLTDEQMAIKQKVRFSKFWLLPIILVLTGVALFQLLPIPLDFHLQAAPTEGDVRNVIWNVRHLDLVGQIVILLAGAFGVVVLFKDSANDK